MWRERVTTIMKDLDINNANRNLNTMILRAFYNDLGEMVSDKLEEISYEKEGITVTYVNGQRMCFTVELLDKEKILDNRIEGIEKQEKELMEKLDNLKKEVENTKKN